MSSPESRGARRRCRASPSSCRCRRPRILLIASRLIGFDDPGGVFTIMIQLGSILAIMWLYRQKIVHVVADPALAILTRAISRCP